MLSENGTYKIQWDSFIINNSTTLAELSEYMTSTSTPVAATNVSVEADVDNGVTADTLQATISALAARIQALEEATP